MSLAIDHRHVVLMAGKSIQCGKGKKAVYMSRVEVEGFLCVRGGGVPPMPAPFEIARLTFLSSSLAFQSIAVSIARQSDPSRRVESDLLDGEILPGIPLYNPDDVSARQVVRMLIRRMPESSMYTFSTYLRERIGVEGSVLPSYTAPDVRDFVPESVAMVERVKAFLVAVDDVTAKVVMWSWAYDIIYMHNLGLCLCYINLAKGALKTAVPMPGGLAADVRTFMDGVGVVENMRGSPVAPERVKMEIELAGVHRKVREDVRDMCLASIVSDGLRALTQQAKALDRLADTVHWTIVSLAKEMAPIGAGIGRTASGAIVPVFSAFDTVIDVSQGDDGDGRLDQVGLGLQDILQPFTEEYGEMKLGLVHV